MFQNEKNVSWTTIVTFLSEILDAIVFVRFLKLLQGDRSECSQRVWLLE